MGPARGWAIGFGLGGPLALVLACGSRTGLPVPETPEGDGGVTVLPDGRVVTLDAQPPTDAPFDVPSIDARPIRDARTELCADASATLVYVVTESDTILSFDPPSATFTTLGHLSCPDSRQPFSMAVDRKGIAYVLYAQYSSTDPGNVFRVSLATASCTPTSYVAGQAGFDSFGMGFSANDNDPGETLYVASDDSSGGELGAVDPKSLVLSPVGFFSPAIVGAELSGTGDGRLFAFYSKDTARTSSAIAQIDKATGKVIAEDELPTVGQGQAWAFAFWGGDFYLFTAPDGSQTVVTRYRPSDKSVKQVATHAELIVGAGVSTCAPQQ